VAINCCFGLGIASIKSEYQLLFSKEEQFDRLLGSCWLFSEMVPC